MGVQTSSSGYFAPLDSANSWRSRFEFDDGRVVFKLGASFRDSRKFLSEQATPQLDIVRESTAHIQVPSVFRGIVYPAKPFIIDVSF